MKTLKFASEIYWPLDRSTKKNINQNSNPDYWLVRALAIQNLINYLKNDLKKD